MSRVWTSAQFIVPGSPRNSDPMWLRACHTPKTPPVGSAAIVIRPASKTSNGSISTFPPASWMRLATLSTSSAARYTVQWAGMPSCGGGDAAATDLPLRENIV